MRKRGREREEKRASEREREGIVAIGLYTSSMYMNNNDGGQ